MYDETEIPRRRRIAKLSAEATDNRAELEARHGQVWSTDELRASHFEVIGFMAPFVVVRDRTTGKKGSLEFQQSPRYYFNFVED